MNNKYHAKRTYSELCQREFASKKEAVRAEELVLLLKAGEINYLEFQPGFVLCDKPKITYTADFKYYENTHKQIIKGKDVYSNIPIYEDVKGVLTRDTRTKIAWVHEKFGVEVRLV